MGKFAIKMTLLILVMAAALTAIWIYHQRSLPPEEEPVVIGEPIPEDAHVILARIGCAPGKCPPQYKVGVSGDGTVEFEDQYFYVNYQLRDARLLKANVSPEVVKQIFAEFARVDYLSIKDECGIRDFRGFGRDDSSFKCAKCATEKPTVLTSITWKRKYRILEHYTGCGGTETLTALTNLEQRFDEILRPGQWLNRSGQLHGDGNHVTQSMSKYPIKTSR